MSGVILNERKLESGMHVQVYEHGRASKALTIIFHGFPGEEKNEDIAQLVSGELGHLVILPHHIGLGKSVGQFSFYTSVREGIDFLKSAQNEISPLEINVIGHSWGGLIAINAFNEISRERRGKLVLIAPFSYFPDDNTLRSIIGQFVADYPSIFENYPINHVLKDIRMIESKYAPRRIIEELEVSSADLSFVQGTYDETIPLETTRELRSIFSEKSKLIELDDDHKFTGDREQIGRVVLDLLKGGTQ